MMLRLLSTACVTVLAAAALGQGRVWLVDASGGPKAHFTDIPPAVAAAADGDTLIVRNTGTYGGFTTGKAITILGDDGVTTTTEVRITGLAAGKTFVAKNVLALAGLVLADNDGRIHLENVGAISTGIEVRDCREVTMSGGVLMGTFVFGPPPLRVMGSTLAMSRVTATGQHACPGPGPPGFAEPAMTVSDSLVYLSQCNVTGGSACPRSPEPLQDPAAAIRLSSGTLIVTGDASTLLRAGFGTVPTPAIETSGGTVEADTAIRIAGSSGGPPIGGGATVVRRRIVSLTGSGAPPGGNMAAEVVSPAGDIVFLAAGIADDPVATPLGTLFLHPSVLLRLYLGAQEPGDHLSLTIPVPNVAALRGGALALQAANFYQSTARVELSNPVVVVLY